jgi:hypothetical protein
VSLLDRIARSQGNPHRSKLAKDLVVRQRLSELGQPSKYTKTGRLCKRLEQVEKLNESFCARLQTLDSYNLLTSILQHSNILTV